MSEREIPKPVSDLLSFYGLKVNQMNFAQLEVFMESLEIVDNRYELRGETWRRYGWMSHLFHIQDCFARLWYMFWENSDETDCDKDIDAAYDLINFTAFFIRLHKAREKMGPSTNAKFICK